MDSGPIFFGATPSDPRAMNNVIALFRRHGTELSPRRQNQPPKENPVTTATSTRHKLTQADKDYIVANWPRNEGRNLGAQSLRKTILERFGITSSRVYQLFDEASAQAATTFAPVQMAALPHAAFGQVAAERAEEHLAELKASQLALPVALPEPLPVKTPQTEVEALAEAIVQLQGNVEALTDLISVLDQRIEQRTAQLIQVDIEQIAGTVTRLQYLDERVERIDTYLAQVSDRVDQNAGQLSERIESSISNLKSLVDTVARATSRNNDAIMAEAELRLKVEGLALDIGAQVLEMKAPKVAARLDPIEELRRQLNSSR
jgi:flagellin-like hook-associated protein FlgL